MGAPIPAVAQRRRSSRSSISLRDVNAGSGLARRPNLTRALRARTGDHSYWVCQPERGIKHAGMLLSFERPTSVAGGAIAPDAASANSR